MTLFKVELNPKQFDNDSNEKKNITNHQLSMFYHTILRNVGLTTAVSLATLGYSRFYREKNKIYTLLLAIASILIVFSSAMINRNLYYSVKNYNKNKSLDSANSYMIINELFFIVHAILLGLGVYTIIRIIRNDTY